MQAGDSIINTTSITSYHGMTLIDYSSTKGAITSFTRSLSTNLAKNKTGIRVNGVAPAQSGHHSFQAALMKNNWKILVNRHRWDVWDNRVKSLLPIYFWPVKKPAIFQVRSFM